MQDWQTVPQDTLGYAAVAVEPHAGTHRTNPSGLSISTVYNERGIALKIGYATIVVMRSAKFGERCMRKEATP